MAEQWVIEDDHWTFDIKHGGRFIARTRDRATAERIVRALSWDMNATGEVARLREAIERHCRAFESSPLPGMALVVGDLRAALTTPSGANRV